jgi:hypothetical protein
MNWGVGAPLASPCLISAFVKTISASFTVRSSSLEAPSCATDGRMQTGGTERYCQINSSGRPQVGCSPRSSQSCQTDLTRYLGENINRQHTSSDIRLNKSSTFNGFKSSCTALLINTANSFCASIAGANVFFHFSISDAVFFARNLSWMIFNAPAFFTAPFVAEQWGQ